MDENGRETKSADAVRQTYDQIAGHFAKTRRYPWPEVESFVTAASGGDLGIDVGCGNGRHAELLADRVNRVVGVDVSVGLLGEAIVRAREHGYQFEPVAGDAAALPLATGCADLAVYVATLHHLPTREARINSLDELARVLALDGRALVSAWSTEHDRFDREAGFDTTVDWTLPGGETVPRFYHVYDSEEFRKDIAASRLELLEFEVSSGNCYATVTPGTSK